MGGGAVPPPTLFFVVTGPMLRKMELVKALPASISFDMDGYEQSYLNDVIQEGGE